MWTVKGGSFYVPVKCSGQFQIKVQMSHIHIRIDENNPFVQVAIILLLAHYSRRLLITLFNWWYQVPELEDLFLDQGEILCRFCLINREQDLEAVLCHRCIARLHQD